MTRNKAIAELVRIWHSPHLDLMLKAGLAEVIDTLKESNLNDSLVRGEVDACKESESKLDLISREDAIKNAHFPMIDDAGYEVVRVDDILALPSAEPKKETVLCALADRTCPFQGKEYAWCLTCPHISEEDRKLVRKVASQSKTGEWVLKGHLWECDQCGCRINRAKPLKGNIWNYHYCPNCGARMLGEDGEEE